MFKAVLVALALICFLPLIILATRQKAELAPTNIGAFVFVKAYSPFCYSEITDGRSIQICGYTNADTVLNPPLFLPLSYATPQPTPFLHGTSYPGGPPCNTC